MRKKKTPTRSSDEARPQPGICRVCGCTQDRACLQGCAWADKTKTLCTTCASVACMVGM